MKVAEKEETREEKSEQRESVESDKENEDWKEETSPEHDGDTEYHPYPSSLP